MAFSMPQMPGALCGKPQGRGAARLTSRARGGGRLETVQN